MVFRPKVIAMDKFSTETARADQWVMEEAVSGSLGGSDLQQNKEN